MVTVHQSRVKVTGLRLGAGGQRDPEGGGLIPWPVAPVCRLLWLVHASLYPRARSGLSAAQARQMRSRQRRRRTLPRQVASKGRAYIQVHT